jgi:F-type H+-transporting ATPase subunit epsilon
MSGQLTLRVITPDRIVLDTTVDSVRFPAVDGSMGVLPRHAAMVAALDVGPLRFQKEGREAQVFVSGGFAEVRANTVRVVTEAGESPEEIDLARARAAERRARERLDQARGPAPAIDVLRAELALRRALVRLRVAGSRPS